MIAMHQPSAVFPLPIPVLFSNMKPSAARYGHRKPDPHDRPAALPFIVHGDNRRGAVLVSFSLSPFVADRLKNGIQLSAAVDIFGRFNQGFSECEDALSEKLYMCQENSVPYQWMDDPETFWPKIFKFMNNRFANYTEEQAELARIFREYCGSWYEIRNSIIYRLSLGDIEACGRKKSPDCPFSIMEISLFGKRSEINFRESHLKLDKLAYYDVRIASHSGLPIHCAMLAYGNPRQVESYLELSRVHMRGKDKEKYQARLDETTFALRQQIFALLHEGLLRAVTVQGQHRIEAGAWKDPEVNMEASALRDAEGTWRECRVLSPLAIRKQPDLLGWRPEIVSPQTPMLLGSALEPAGKLVFQASDDSLIQFAVEEDKRRADEGEDLLDTKERLSFLRKYQAKLTENYLKTKLMPQIRKQAELQNVPLRRQGQIKQGVSK